MLTHRDVMRPQYCADTQLYLLLRVAKGRWNEFCGETFSLTSSTNVNMIFAPAVILAGFLSLAGALAVAPNAELVPRSPCYTRASGGPIRCRISPGTNHATVKVLGDNKWFNPKCKDRGGSVGGNR